MPKLSEVKAFVTDPAEIALCNSLQSMRDKYENPVRITSFDGIKSGDVLIASDRHGYRVVSISSSGKSAVLKEMFIPFSRRIYERKAHPGYSNHWLTHRVYTRWLTDPCRWNLSTVEYADAVQAARYARLRQNVWRRMMADSENKMIAEMEREMAKGV